MSGTFQKIRNLIVAGDVRISEHGYDELAQDGLTAREIVDGVESAVLVEDYPDFPKGSAVLLLQKDREGASVHAVWGIPRGQDRPAVLVTAYRPDPERWEEGFTTRKK
jgi:hypothetical protein